MNYIKAFVTGYHPIVHTLFIGTIMARAASSMSLPFLAIYLSTNTSMGPALIGLTIGAGSLAGTFGGFIGGHLSDKYGRKVVMMSSLYVWGLVFLGFAFSAYPILFLLLNTLNGLCRSTYEPTSQALMADLTPAEKRYRVFSIRYFCINLGVAVGPLLGAFFALVDARLPWTITGIVYLVYALLLGLLMSKFDIKRIEGAKKDRVTLAGAANIVRMDGRLRYYIMGGILVAIGYSQMTSTLSQFVEGRFVDGVTLFAWLMSVNAITVIALQLPLSRWAERKSPMFSITCGNLFYAAGLIGFGIAQSGWHIVAAMIVFTIGEVLTFPAGSVLIDRIAPEQLRGTYFGAQQFSSFGHFVGPWFGGLLLTQLAGGPMFAIFGAICVSSILFYRLGYKRAAVMEAAPTAERSASAT